jgi:hypothetical protein
MTSFSGLGDIDRARTYDELRKLIDARRRKLGLTMLDLDVDAGLQDGYSSKLMVGIRNFGPKSLEAVLKALGVEIKLVPRDEITVQHPPQ